MDTSSATDRFIVAVIMHLLPSCFNYLCRLLKKTLRAKAIPLSKGVGKGEFSRSQPILDLLQQADAADYTADDSIRYAIADYDLDRRLHVLYPNERTRSAVILHLEQLIYSHQHAKVRQDEPVLQAVTDEMLWWLGFATTLSVSGASVFVVDDTVEILKLATVLLTQAGYTVNSALNGQSALIQIGALRPDVVLLDINLPDIDGYEVYQQLQAAPETAHIPVIFLTGVEKNPQGRARSAGYLAKPFRAQALLECVHKTLKRVPAKPLPKTKMQGPKSVEGLMLHNVLSARRTQAEQLPSCLIENSPATGFFRATLDGSYLRISPGLALLCGYPSAEEMMTATKNVWSHVVDPIAFQLRWADCLQSPAQVQTLFVQIQTPQERVLDMVEKIQVVRDEHGHCLFYQGCMTGPRDLSL
ncbi:MAG: response regulator [Cyanobacteria bacterium J06649_5]